MVPDFTGYVTKYGIKCSDGRTIMAHAFSGNDGAKIPLVWQHQHNDPNNVLGHLLLKHVDDGVRADGFFNETEAGKQAKALVEHKDINALSIYANQLVQQGQSVTHGNIREGSLVLAGANPGAFIDNVNIMHGDDVKVLDDEVIVYSGEILEHAVAGSTTVLPPAKVVVPSKTVPAKGVMPKAAATPPAAGDGPSVEDVLSTLNPEQKNVVYAIIGAAVSHSGVPSTDNNEKGDAPVTRNVFDKTDATDDKKTGTATLSHADTQGIFAAALKLGSLKEAVEEYALSHGIDSIETLFPTEQAVTDTPEFISRRTAWVAAVLNGTHKTPFARIKSLTADITMDEARAKGYVKGNMKKEEFFTVAKRVTTPQTVYKKQKLDRDDIVDITDFDVVAWLQTEMRLMLDEELARAILFGDGRDIDDDDKINPANIRPIVGDDELYVTTINVDLVDSSSSADEIVDAVINGMQYYRGTGNPVFYTTLPYLTTLFQLKDTLGRRIYANLGEIQSAMGVSAIVPVEAMQSVTGLIGVIVNLTDYNVGADRQGAVSLFDFFDIDYNQYKYLIETRVSGALIKYKSAVVLQAFSGAGGMLGEPTAPTFVDSTGVGTIPTFTHATYVVVASDGTEGSALTAGAQTAIAAGTSVHYRAKAASTYSFPDNANTDWTFTRDAS
jgi:Phage capsid family/Caudovirus prohead serine protease